MALDIILATASSRDCGITFFIDLNDFAASVVEYTVNPKELANNPIWCVKDSGRFPEIKHFSISAFGIHYVPT